MLDEGGLQVFREYLSEYPCFVKLILFIFLN